MPGPVITRFDPWKNRLCTCPPKMVLSPYVGCSHACTYCYITSYIPRAFSPRYKEKFIERLEKFLSQSAPKEPIEMAASSDVYQPMESDLYLTRAAIKLLSNFNCKVQILTKSDLVLRDIDILTGGRFSVGMTITTLDESIARVLEPRAPEPSRRISALEKLSDSGIPTFARIDPILPWINDSGLEKLSAELRDAGVRHVTCSTFKARWDSLRRIAESFPNEGKMLTNAYRRGELVGRTLYLPKGMRMAIMSIARKFVRERGMTFSTCREGIPIHKSAPTCDGTHLIP